MNFHRMSNQVIPKTRILFFLLCFISGFSWGQSLAYRTLLSGLYDGDFPTIKPEQVTKISDYQILDAREKGEFEVSHIQGAKWVGYDTFSLSNVASLDKSKPVIIYCTVGARSQDIGKKLQQEGFAQVYNLYGGIIHWVNEGKPVVSNGKPTQKVHTYSKTWGIWLEKGERVY
ncbi:rhodanese-related sulfurtransferase [Algoriphagus aquaeductus]|uniref:Rhodanese-related sulfurtransferase n=2 Tax=Algoriphagus aquaeductus TaxID=475299 RepID=A0A326RU13_9BACT|nr:rhodanese-related sulfurtransferase [Algoriphagus aquaeductus]